MSDSNDERKTVQDGTVVSLDYTLKVDGEVVDTSEGGDPIEFIQGQGHIITGLENSLYGMEVGESKQLVVSSDEGYGDVDEKAFADIPRSEFPPKIPLEVGVALQLRDQDGEELEAHIVNVGDKVVRLDFNHPLAGKELHFSIKVVDLRPASESEMAHGHVHNKRKAKSKADEDAD
jgi:FKBP-type peptidyl-prolyl cis-trans isomerase SlyD